MMGGGSRPDEMCDLALWCSTTHNSRGADSGKRGIRGSRHQWWCTGTIFRHIVDFVSGREIPRSKSWVPGKSIRLTGSSGPLPEIHKENRRGSESCDVGDQGVLRPHRPTGRDRFTRPL